MRRGGVARSVVVAGLVVIGLGVCVPLYAQSEPAVHIGVIDRPGVPAALQEDLVASLRTRYDVTRVGSSRKSRPVQALHSQLAAAEVDVVLLVSRRRNMLKLEYLDAESGRRFGYARFFVRGGELSDKTQAKVLAATREQLALGSRGEPDGREDITAPDAPADVRAALVVEAGAADDSIDDSSGDTIDDESAQEPPPFDDEGEGEALTAEDPAQDEFELAVVAGLGASTATGQEQSEGLTTRFDAGAALAGGLGARISLGSRSQVHWRVEGRYTTSLERQVSEQHRGGAPQPMSLRTHRFEGGVGPRLPLGGGGFWFAPTLGYALRSVVPEVHFQLIPFYTLGGPYLRLEFETPVFGPSIGLRVSPEAQWLPQASNSVGGSTFTAGRFALAGQVTIFVRVSEAVDFEAFLHESHAWATTEELEVKDMERFVLANVVWRP